MQPFGRRNPQRACRIRIGGEENGDGENGNGAGASENDDERRGVHFNCGDHNVSVSGFAPVQYTTACIVCQNRQFVKETLRLNTIIIGQNNVILETTFSIILTFLYFMCGTTKSWALFCVALCVTIYALKPARSTNILVGNVLTTIGVGFICYQCGAYGRYFEFALLFVGVTLGNIVAKSQDWV